MKLAFSHMFVGTKSKIETYEVCFVGWSVKGMSAALKLVGREESSYQMYEHIELCSFNYFFLYENPHFLGPVDMVKITPKK